ncbi:AraC-like DNA-binding protein [Chitinophaga skermanii]|uniref:AraC-like DNA-binding protein n=1 Tax=Chitinophaga skermanii TaxID=331697 RepID=A0A327QY60_9BACT|nr:helix-turn-helix domain-containing protein [Chitinophaga skermanii]RAJ06607.1 AraC-like DNA-binding protein [Chitinophaga skermanii]
MQSLFLFHPERHFPILHLHRVSDAVHWTRQAMSAIIYIKTGQCRCFTQFSEYHVTAPAFLFFSPYQAHEIMLQPRCTGQAIYFHQDFFCIDDHVDTYPCNGTLFNNIYDKPLLQLPQVSVGTVDEYFQHLRDDLRLLDETQKMHLSLEHFKFLLLLLIRAKQMQPVHTVHPAIERLHQLIDTHYLEWHTPGQYAAALGLNVKSLSKLVANKLGKSPTSLIKEKLVMEAQRVLRHTTKPVQEVAAMTGFHGADSFGKLFRKHTGITPLKYRQALTKALA